jgi:hypothetical protein
VQIFRKQLLFNLKRWDDIKYKNANGPHLHLVCWAVRNTHAALLKSLKESTPYSVHHYFRQAAEWLGWKNHSFLHEKGAKKVAGIFSILLRDLQQMTGEPRPFSAGLLHL